MLNRAFSILLALGALLWAGIPPLQASHMAFFRIVSTQETRIVDFNASSGSLIWTQDGTPGACRIEMAAPMADGWCAICTAPGADGSNGYRTVELATASVCPPFATLKFDTPFVLRTNAVIRSPEEWAALWEAQQTPAPAANVDFSRKMILVVSMGGQISTGYEIWVEHLVLSWNRMIVWYGERYPKPGDAVLWVLTAPCHFVSTQRQDVPCVWLRTFD